MLNTINNNNLMGGLHEIFYVKYMAHSKHSINTTVLTAAYIRNKYGIPHFTVLSVHSIYLVNKFTIISLRICTITVPYYVSVFPYNSYIEALTPYGRKVRPL